MTRRIRSLIAVAAVLIAVAFGVAACTSPRNALGTNSSPCFRALAVAKDAVGGAGRYAGVRYISAKTFLTSLEHSRHSASAPSALRHTRDALCAVNYRGRYSAATVKAGWPAGRTNGQFAVVLVDAKTNVVLGTLVLSHPPLDFSKFLL